MGKKIQFVVWIIVAIATLLLIGGVVYNRVCLASQEVKKPEATFEIENYGTVKMELYPEYAPNTVANFIKLIESGYYNNKVIYGKDEICLYAGRDEGGELVNPTIGLISEDIEAGSEKDYDYTIPGEFVANGFTQNTLRHEKGVITLIRNDYTQYFSNLAEQSYNSGNAQLGIMMSDESSSLNGAYAAFGKITEGLDILEKIYNEAEMKPAETNEDGTTSESSDGIDQFANYPKIVSASVDTHGENYGMPETEEAFDYNTYMYNLMSSQYNQ